MNTEYETYLKGCVTKDLKNLIKKYIAHVTIKVTGKKKSTLINDIMTHTELINGNIYLKPTSFELPPSLKKLIDKTPVDDHTVLATVTKESDDEKQLAILEAELHKHIKSANIKENNDINVKWRHAGLLRLKMRRIRSALNNNMKHKQMDDKEVAKRLVTELRNYRNEARSILYLFE